MLSSRVRNLVDRCRRAQDAMDAYAPRIEERLRAGGGYERSLRHLSAQLAAIADATVEADLAHARTVEAHQEWTERRDGLAAALYREISDLRRDWRDRHDRGLLTRSSGLSGKTPRQPAKLAAWAEALFVNWGVGGVVRNDDFLETGFEARIATARKLVAELKAARAEAGKANLRRAKARDDRRRAIATCKSELRGSARIAEDFLIKSGLRDLVVEVRGKAPRGRPRKDDRTPKTDAAPRKLLRWIGRAVRSAGRLFRRDPEDRRDLGRAA